MQKAVRVRVYGLVQGVFFRASTREQALRHGVTGWVRNRRDGSVEALLQGPDEAVDSMVEWARHGPRGARVERLIAEEVEPDPRFQAGFSIVKELPS
jgi:acylphosphatase